MHSSQTADRLWAGRPIEERALIFRSPHADVSIPEVPLTPFVLQRAAKLGDKAALIDGPTGRALSFSQFAAAVRRAAGGLAGRGFRKGDVFALFAPNVPEWAVAFHAVATLGGINTTINSLFTADDVAYQLKDSGARFLLTVTGPSTLPREAGSTRCSSWAKRTPPPRSPSC